MRVLVTGGGGYLGCRLVRRLLDAGHAVRVFDRFCFGRAALADLDEAPGLEVVVGDIRRLQEAPGLFAGVEAVAHLACLSNDPSCDLNEQMARDVNVESTLELARHAIQHGVRRFVFSSSCNVYGRGVIDQLDEQSPVRPASTFGETKREAEEALLGMRGGGFEPVIARTASLFGWSPRMRFDLAVNQMVARALRYGVIEVRGGGRQWRPFVHVDDAANAFALLLEADAARVGGEIFNVGDTADNWQIKDLATRVAEEMGNTRVEVPFDDEDLRSYRVRCDKLRETLDFACAHSLRDGIREVRARLEDSDIDPFATAYFNVKRMKELLGTPVDEGGEPVAARFIPLSKPGIGAEEEQAVARALRSGWLTSGPQIAAFENAFRETVRAPHAIAVSSCTAALHLCLAALGVGPGDEVVTSPITWASTGNTIINMGARVVFADIDPETLNMDPGALERAITERTRAIMPVHMAGHPCDLGAVEAVARKHGVPVVEDAAHALGAAYEGRPIGSRNQCACFSFYAIKNITTMEGGMVTLPDGDLAARIRRLAANGMAATAWDRYSRSAVAAPPEVVEPGFKYLMSNVSAAMGVAQLEKFPEFMAARKRLAACYDTVLSDVDEVRLPVTRPGIGHAWHLYIIRFRLDRLRMNRDELAHALRRENIGTGCHFYGLHLHQYYREVLGMRPEDLPQATRASHEVLSLPLYPQMAEKDVQDTAAALKKVLRHARR